jgi:hypothetical protein
LVCLAREEIFIHQALFSLSHWDSLSSAQRISLSEDIAAYLPDSVQFQGVENHHLGNQVHQIAYFLRDSVRFALLPSYDGFLGYDHSLTIQPSHEDEWKRDDCSDLSISEFLERHLSPRREVHLSPFFIEDSATKLITPLRGENGWYYDGSVIRWRDIQQQVNNKGLRLPTRDEWEYACGGGSTALFRWGDEIPDGWPSEGSDSHIERLTDVHLVPNAFGLRIGQEFYLEWIDIPDIAKGSDGGAGSQFGRIANWLGFATAYECHIKGYLSRHACLRQVFSLPFREFN